MESEITNVNDPNLKYDAQKENSLNESQVSDSNNEPLSFFNYHEFLINDYEFYDPSHSSKTSSTSPLNTTSSTKKSIVISHFPNNYAPISSPTYNTTRIIRIPRAYDTHSLSYLIPQFSTYKPGMEPAALIDNDEKQFRAIGEFDNHNLFGPTSLTPLVPNLISEQELKQIIETTNSYLVEAFNPYSFVNFLENTLDILTGTLYSKLFNRFILTNQSRQKLLDLETYIEIEVNENTFNKNNRDIRVISPRKSDYLSVRTLFPIEVLTLLLKLTY